LRLLVVEDQDVFRKRLRCLLEEEGFEVADAPNAQEGLECVARFQPDIVLMDVSLPGMSGLEATQMVLRLAPQTAVVMLSMFDGEDLTSLALDAGVTRISGRRGMSTPLLTAAARRGSQASEAAVALIGHDDQPCLAQSATRTVGAASRRLSPSRRRRRPRCWSALTDNSERPSRSLTSNGLKPSTKRSTTTSRWS
jgi:DNA-binding NarL/FixJ family response regulator